VKFISAEILIDKMFFIKKVLFKSDVNNICELISINKEVKDNKDFAISVEVLASLFREYPHNNKEFVNLDIKRYISEEDAEQLSQLISNESAFLEQIDNIIQ
jgi:hypothetical protein